ncbi:MAG: TM2 domain-containing protein [Treponema sp.]|jgi:TM2 domain-containing membrane protein YozV|nr:TM2 domain-containing protein [Treponema sp.]
MKRVGIAYLFWLFSGCGLLGLHRFYLGKVPTGLLWMCTGGLAGIGAVYDFFTLPRQVREANWESALYLNAANQSQSRRYINSSWDESYGPKPKDSVERHILRLGRQNKGILTVTEVALEADLSLDDARKQLDSMVSRGFAEIRVRKTGTLVYTLPEFMDRDAPLEDF